MVFGGCNDHERKTACGLGSPGGGDRFSVSPLFELDDLRVSESRRVQLSSDAGAGEVYGRDLLLEPVVLSIFLTVTGKQRFSFDVLVVRSSR
jgi:hypothetical protein